MRKYGILSFDPKKRRLVIDQAKNILKTVFGYAGFVSLQEEIVQNVLRKKDTLAIMPTGGGKSLCYQLPALIFPGLTVVISPLISLMKDQVEQLHASGVDATLLNSSLSPAEYRQNVARVKKGEVKLLYLAPESLLKTNMLDLLSSVSVDCLAIDEAHCISAWGHDFRPEYRQLASVRAGFPDAVCIALTATATPRVREDIRTSLGFESSDEFIASFDRENLFLRVLPKNKPLEKTIHIINEFPNQPGIIYCATRRQVDELSAILEDKRFSVRPYHAGLPEMERSQNQELFIKDDVQIIVATIAFGMGINKSNIRFVVHFDLPQNIESYYQEIGRAGRDGLRADCLLLFSYADIQKIRFFINKKEGHEKRLANIHLNTLLQFVETEVCRRIPLLNYFGEEYAPTKCDMCDNCLAEHTEKVDITVAAQKFLSCVKRTGERFGAAHIINVLRGSRAQKVLNLGHDNLSTYGIGMEYSKKQWLQLSRQFLHQGLMIQDMEFGGLKLSPKAWDVFKGKEIILGRVDDDTPASAGPEAEIKTAPDHDEALFQILRQKRKELADEADVPPYVIFSDKTLIEMATYFPHAAESLLGIHGVGAVKFEKYGAPFLALIEEYCQKHGIGERTKHIPKTVSSSVSIKKKRYIIIGEAYNCGQSVESLMAEFNIKQTTVLNHLYKYLLEGNPLRFDELLSLSSIPAAKREQVFEAYKTLGTERLRPVFDACDEEIGYDELQLLRLYYIGRHGINRRDARSDSR